MLDHAVAGIFAAGHAAARRALLCAALLLASCGGDDTTDTTEVLPGSLAVTTTTLPDATLRAAYTTTLTASGGTPPYTWFRPLGTIPPGVALDQAAGVLIGTPTAAGEFSFTVKVFDALGASDSTVLGLRVIGPPPIVISPFPPLTVTVGEPVAIQFEATGGRGVFHWYALPVAPPLDYLFLSGLALTNDGRLTGVPKYPAGTYPFRLQVLDLDLETVLPVELKVVAPSGLRIETTTLPDIHEAQPYSAPLIASGGAPPYTFSRWQIPQPTGLTFADGELSGMATETSGTPTRPDTLDVLVTDAVGASAFAVLPFTYVAQPLGIPAFTFPAGTVGLMYEVFLYHNGPQASDDWTVSSGALPDGVTLVNNGPISGTFGAKLTGSPTRVGVFEFDLTVTVNGQSASRHFAITINAPPLVITTATLPHATTATPYQVFLVANGGTAPYAWSVASGALPSGFSLSPDGELSGTSSASGTFAFTVRVDDAGPAGLGQSDAAALSLTVDP
jgi:large repetitive protein